MPDKKCSICSEIMLNVHHAKKYCDGCKKESLKINQNKHHNKFILIKKDSNIKKLQDNFNILVREPFHLTGKGFNSISEIKCKAYTQILNKKWIKILKDYNVFENLLDYIVDSYRIFYAETGKINLQEFAKWNKYCTYDLLNEIGTNEIKKRANIKMTRYQDEEFVSNFEEICNSIGKPPLYNEFETHTKISLNTYVNRFKLKGKVYNQLMKILLDERQYEAYLERYSNHKKAVGTITGSLSAQYDDNDYRNEFNRVFEFCLTEFGNVPSRRLFNELSKFDVSTYRRKYNKSWLDICEMYGFKVERNHKVEKMVLNSIKELTGEDYIPQKTWNWLIGTGGKNMYCDGFFSNLNLVVEFDGRQHKEPVEKFGGVKAFQRLQANDKKKESLLKDNKIKLIRIASDDPWFDKNFIQNLLIKSKVPILTPLPK